MDVITLAQEDKDYQKIFLNITLGNKHYISAAHFNDFMHLFLFPMYHGMVVDHYAKNYSPNHKFYDLVIFVSKENFIETCETFIGKVIIDIKDRESES